MFSDHIIYNFDKSQACYHIWIAERLTIWKWKLEMEIASFQEFKGKLMKGNNEEYLFTWFIR